MCDQLSVSKNNQYFTTDQFTGLSVMSSSATLSAVAEIRSAANTHGDARRAKINSNSNRGSRQNGFIKCTCIFIYKLVSVRKRVTNAPQSERRRIFSSVLSVPKCNYRAQPPAASFVCCCCRCCCYCCCYLYLLFLGANILFVCL